MQDIVRTSAVPRVQVVDIEHEMERSYMDYAMSVIVSRALPDVRDGLKPVQRRILYAMKEGGYDWNRSYRKSARIIGDVMGQYHPHGDPAIYAAMVRMAQNFSMRLELVDGQGNFGSVDGDPPAAMRYTEARLTRAASDALLEDISRDAVDFRPNYDESTHEPEVLPSRFPNLLVNGAGGIAVGMATNIPPHNLAEIIDACCALLDDPQLSLDGLCDIVPGPDFPTGARILGQHDCRQAYQSGRGSVRVRACAHVEEKERRIVITEIPYQVNKARAMEKIAELVRSKVIEGISDLRDESDRSGMRVVIELKRATVAEVVLNQLYRHTPLQISFGVNMVALVGGRPRSLTLKACLEHFLAFREEVLRRRSAFLLARARERGHLMAGLAIAVENLDDMIAIIRNAEDAEKARQQLMSRNWAVSDVLRAQLRLLEDRHDDALQKSGSLSEKQAKAILELRLQRLTGLERDKIVHELQETMTQIRAYLTILSSRDRLLALLRKEILEIRERYASPRRTEIVDAVGEEDEESLIQKEDIAITVTLHGYIKRTPLDAYRAQKRGGKGRSGMSTREDDAVARVYIANTHTPILFFTSRGMVYRIKAWRLPVGVPSSRGRSLVNLLPLRKGEKITALLLLPENQEHWEGLYLFFVTSYGFVRRNPLESFRNINANGKIAMKLESGDGHVVSVVLCLGSEDALLATANGKAVRFPVKDVRVFKGRNSTGVLGVRLQDGDRVIALLLLGSDGGLQQKKRELFNRYSMALRRLEEEEAGRLSVRLGKRTARRLLQEEEFILSISSDGLGKRTSAYEYRRTARGGKGIDAHKLERPGKETASVVAAFPVKEHDQIMLVTADGQTIRSPVVDVRIVARSTMGVRLLRLSEGHEVVSAACLQSEEIAGGRDPVDAKDADGVH